MDSYLGLNNNKRNQYSFLNNLKIYILFILSIIIIFIFNLNKIKSLKDTNDLKKRLNLLIEFNKIYSELYYISKSGKSLKPEIFNHDKKINYLLNKENGICLCTIGKNENLYAREFIEYYYLLGFNKIIIFDNNEINGEKFDEILGDYIKNNFVEIIDIRGLLSIQIAVYNYCYTKYNHLYDWFAFFDFDEFLYIKNHSNIKIVFLDLSYNNIKNLLI